MRCGGVIASVVWVRRVGVVRGCGAWVRRVATRRERRFPHRRDWG